MGKHFPIVAALVCGLCLGITAGLPFGCWVGGGFDRNVATATALVQTTAERDRLLEHLADVESGQIGENCVPTMVWQCPIKGGSQ